jgi:hypothetical protein
MLHGTSCCQANCFSPYYSDFKLIVTSTGFDGEPKIIGTALVGKLAIGSPRLADAVTLETGSLRLDLFHFPCPDSCRASLSGWWANRAPSAGQGAFASPIESPAPQSVAEPPFQLLFVSPVTFAPKPAPSPCSSSTGETTSVAAGSCVPLHLAAAPLETWRQSPSPNIRLLAARSPAAGCLVQGCCTPVASLGKGLSQSSGPTVADHAQLSNVLSLCCVCFALPKWNLLLGE